MRSGPTGTGRGDQTFSKISSLLLLSVCKEESCPSLDLEERSSRLDQEERSSSLDQEEPQPPQIKEEHEEEADDVSTVTSLHMKTTCDTLSGKILIILLELI